MAYGSDKFIRTLGNELEALEGIHGQDPETGAGGKKSSLGNYTNKLFGAPYQLLDSVDKRFPSINGNLGTEYLRNFILHSPILHIRPGMPQYTGGTDPTSMKSIFQDIYLSTSASDDPGKTSARELLRSLAQNTIFSAGSNLQRRMFGVRTTYNEYMMYVNYMCRSVAVLLGLVENGIGLPNGAFVTKSSAGDVKFERFESIRWENYRMIGSSYVNSSLEYSKEFGKASGILAAGETVQSVAGFLNPLGDNFLSVSTASDKIMEAFDEASKLSFYQVMSKKIQSVMFMVEPISFDESITNQTDKSFIESSIDAVSGSIGSEIAFITGSKADPAIIGELTSFLGSGVESASMNLSKLVEPVTGGFTTNLFSGAIKSLKGQKLIYPDIYKASTTTMDYKFSITLTTPYGDIYNYYMNIIVPLLHLIALAAPRMVTANTTASPFLIQGYIPGMCTCQMGIISDMVIVKNPNTKHVSVNGFPLTVKVNFTIKELYNAMAISPAHDPASFMFNETLNDYMANLAGLIPSIDTYTKQRKVMFENLSEYFESGDWAAGMGDWMSTSAEDIFKRATI